MSKLSGHKKDVPWHIYISWWSPMANFHPRKSTWAEFCLWHVLFSTNRL